MGNQQNVRNGGEERIQSTAQGACKLFGRRRNARSSARKLLKSEEVGEK